MANSFVLNWDKTPNWHIQKERILWQLGGIPVL